MSLGQQLLEIARKTVEAALSNRNLRLKADVRKKLSAQHGVFVNLYNNNELRGSFGYPPGAVALADSIKRAARGAAFQDKRFASITKKEFDKLRFEVVLVKSMTQLTVKKPEGYFRKINPKKHGLYVRYGPFRAMQLPVFAQHYGLNARDYLEKTLEKAGLAPESWQSPNCKVFIFTAESCSE